MELTFTAGILASIEAKLHKSLLEIMSTYSVTHIAVIVEKAMFLRNEQEAYKKIDEYLAVDGNNLVDLFQEIMKKMQDGDFLSRDQEIQGNPLPTPIETPASQSNGN